MSDLEQPVRTGTPESPRAIPRSSCLPGHGICLWVLAGKLCYGDEHCTGSHAAFADRPPCATFVARGRCERGASCWFPHVEPVVRRDGVGVVLQVTATHRERTSAYVRHVAGADLRSLHEARARGLNRNGDGLLLLDVPRAVVERLVSDPILSLALRRAYAVSWTGDSLAAAVAHARDALDALPPPSAPDAATTVRVQAYPPRDEAGIVEALDAAGAGAAPRRWALSRARADVTVSVVGVDGVLYVGVSPADDPTVRIGAMSSMQGEVVAAASPRGAAPPLCRAFYKLWEVARRTGALAAGRAGAAGGPAAVDVGASPGGWSQFLVQQAGFGRVFAVDPGEVDAALLSGAAVDADGASADGGGAVVEHLRMRGEAAVGALLARGMRGALDAYTCDANVPTLHAAELFEAAAVLLRPGAVVVGASLVAAGAPTASGAHARCRISSRSPPLYLSLPLPAHAQSHSRTLTGRTTCTWRTERRRAGALRPRAGSRPRLRSCYTSSTAAPTRRP